MPKKMLQAALRERENGLLHSHSRQPTRPTVEAKLAAEKARHSSYASASYETDREDEETEASDG